ncbi:LysR family transcriptional regulator [Lichenihabitans sp. PAMC28606]|uniref:LysR family transcriptional regulator n=1 Tax=Lichenihabitans sp. PAMC28606 TaxID=2880932 RepID=UPI0039B63624
MAIAEEGIFTIAAEKRLHTAQPSISRQMRDLETELGCALMIALPDRRGAGRQFSDILDDETRMSAVFETFLRNFYREEVKGTFKVKGERLNWPAKAATDVDLAYLPDMLTDMTLRSMSALSSSMPNTISKPS